MTRLEAGISAGPSAFDPVVSDSERDQGGAPALLEPDDSGAVLEAVTNAFADSRVGPGLTVAELWFGGTFELTPHTVMLVLADGQGQAYAQGSAAVRLDLGGTSSNGIRQDQAFGASATSGVAESKKGLPFRTAPSSLGAAAANRGCDPLETYLA